jgi:hypothetical protein
LLHNCAIQRNAARISLASIISEKRAAQNSPTMRNSLGLNYKSAALNQLSYAGATHTKAVFSELIKSSPWPISRTALQKGPKFHGIFLRHERWFRTPRGAGGVSFNTVNV